MTGNATATKRLVKEFSLLQREPNINVKDLGPVDESNLYLWRGSILGDDDDDGPYAGGEWDIEITIPSNYPNEPPSVRFLTRICHPNIDFFTGEICLDLLNSAGWSPVFTISSLCDSIRLLVLQSPAPDSPLNIDAACLLRSNDSSAYNGLIRFYTRQYAAAPCL